MQPQHVAELRTLEHQLGRALGRCIAEFGLIEPNDRIMVCLSGGKDSYTLLTLLEQFRRHAPFDFELLAVHLDQGQPGYDGAPLRAWLEEQGYAHHILREDTYSVVVDKVEPGKTYCSLCSRLRRGVLYNAAEALSCTKIALGHHRDDAIETLLLNLVYNGAMASMPAKLVSRDRRNVVIRPLLFAAEKSIARYAELRGFPILPCNLCGSQEQLKRKQVKALLQDLERFAPLARASMLSAMGNLKPAHLLDRDLLRALEGAAPDGAGAALEGEEAEPELARAAPSPLATSGRRRLPLMS